MMTRHGVAHCCNPRVRCSRCSSRTSPLSICRALSSRIERATRNISAPCSIEESTSRPRRSRRAFSRRRTWHKRSTGPSLRPTRRCRSSSLRRYADADHLHRALPSHRAGRGARAPRVSGFADGRSAGRAARLRGRARGRDAANLRPPRDLRRARRLRARSRADEIVPRELSPRSDRLRHRVVPLYATSAIRQSNICSESAPASTRC